MTSTATLPPSPTATGPGGCVTVTPGKYGRVPPDACNSYYNYDPSFGGAVLMSVAFGVVTAAHIGLGIAYQKHLTGEDHVTKQPIFHASGVNAFAYMLLGRMIHFYLPEKKLCGIKAPAIARYFVCFDILSFIVQGIGGSMISPGADQKTVMNGIHVYMGGIGLQELFILIFLALVVKFYRRMQDLVRRREIIPKEGWKRLSWTLYIALALITMRIVYRLVEYASGVKPSNPLPFHEGYLYGLDALPMFIAITVFCAIHPGRFLRGPDSVFPKKTRAQKKQEKKEKKEMKKAKKEAKKAEKEAKKGKVASVRREELEMERGETWEREGVR
ncbi:hypothetical protein GP486_007671, partial [Trichoglossum hirsutum]